MSAAQSATAQSSAAQSPTAADLARAVQARETTPETLLQGALARIEAALQSFPGEGALAFAAGLQGGWDAVALTYFVCCGVSRLARFNVTAEALSGEGGKVKYFEGTPIPTSLALVMVLAFFFWKGRTGDALPFGVWEVGGGQIHPLVLMYLVSGSAMISKTLRIPKF